MHKIHKNVNSLFSYPTYRRVKQQQLQDMRGSLKEFVIAQLQLESLWKRSKRYSISHWFSNPTKWKSHDDFFRSFLPIENGWFKSYYPMKVYAFKLFRRKSIFIWTIATSTTTAAATWTTKNDSQRMTLEELELYTNEVSQYYEKQGHIAKICWWIPNQGSQNNDISQALAALTLDNLVVDPFTLLTHLKNYDGTDLILI